jgi:Polyketide cyclase / dehydrase and lipid transport
MKLTSYRFRSIWNVEAPLTDASAVLRDPGTYPAWWPEVKEAVRVGEEAYRMRVRSFLPYDLLFTTTKVREDLAAGILEASLAGDIEGFSRWLLAPTASGTRLIFEEEVTTHKPLLNRLALVARPAFRGNHAVMMRRGEAGLRVYLAGRRSIEPVAGQPTNTMDIAGREEGAP